MYHYFVSFAFGSCKFGNIEVSSTLPLTTYEDIVSCTDVIQEKCQCKDRPIILSFSLLRKDEN